MTYIPAPPASAFAKIAETILGSDAASITLSSIPGTYRSLLLVFALSTDATSNPFVGVRFNGDTGSNYAAGYVANGGAWTASGVQSYMQLFQNFYGDGRPAMGHLWVPDYARTTWKKTFVSDFTVHPNTTGAVNRFLGSGDWNDTAAITSLTILQSTGNLKTGSVVTLYGLED